MVSHAIVSRPGGIHIKRDGRDPEGSKRKMIDAPTAVQNESDELRSQIGSCRQRMKLCPLQPKQIVSKSCRPSSLLHYIPETGSWLSPSEPDANWLFQQLAKIQREEQVFDVRRRDKSSRELGSVLCECIDEYGSTSECNTCGSVVFLQCESTCGLIVVELTHQCCRCKFPRLF